MQQGTPLNDTRSLVSGSRIWWSGLKGVVGKDIVLCGINGQEKLTGTARTWWVQVFLFKVLGGALMQIVFLLFV